MERSEVLEQVKKILAKVAAHQDLEGKSLADLSFDSLRHVELLIELETCFKIDFGHDALAHEDTVETIVDRVMQLLD
jgi:acyl carrier protein